MTKVCHRAVCAGMFFASESVAKKHTGADGLANTPNIANYLNLTGKQNIAHPQNQTHLPENKLFQRLIHQLLDHATVILALRPRRLRHQ
jgi:hypothetical protein